MLTLFSLGGGGRVTQKLIERLNRVKLAGRGVGGGKGELGW